MIAERLNRDEVNGLDDKASMAYDPDAVAAFVDTFLTVLPDLRLVDESLYDEAFFRSSSTG